LKTNCAKLNNSFFSEIYFKKTFRIRKYVTAVVTVVYWFITVEYIKQLAARSGCTRHSSGDTVIRLHRAISVDVAVKKKQSNYFASVGARFSARLMQRWHLPSRRRLGRLFVAARLSIRLTHAGRCGHSCHAAGRPALRPSSRL